MLRLVGWQKSDTAAELVLELSRWEQLKGRGEPRDAFAAARRLRGSRTWPSGLDLVRARIPSMALTSRVAIPGIRS